MRYRVGIRDLRDSLSRWIEKVKRGHRVEVTDHGRTVAVLSAPGPARKARTEEEHLEDLEARGLVRRGDGTAWRPTRPLVIPGVDLPGAVLEDRDEEDR